MPRHENSAAVLSERIGNALVEFVSEIPSSRIPQGDADAASSRISRKAAARAASLSAGLSLPSGLLGMVTFLPDLLGIWRIQAQMVADIAAAHGRLAQLSREQMVFCLFRHAAAQVMRDIAVQAGQRWIVHKLTSAALRRMLDRIGSVTARRFVARLGSRFIPIAGAAASGAYAYWDTLQVARTATALFQNLESDAPQSHPPTREPLIPAEAASQDNEAPMP